MTDVIETTDALHASANRLYWQSHDSVEELAVRLGMSPNALHASIRPHPADAACSICGGALAFRNRADRRSGSATCENCGAAERLSTSAESEAPPLPLVKERRWPGELRRVRRELAMVRPERAAMIGGAAALGMAVGVLALDFLRASRW